MLRLAFPTEPAWHDLGYGVSVLVRPFTTAAAIAADARAWREQERQRAAAEALGQPDPFAGQALETAAGLGWAIKWTAIAQELIAEWRGVGLAEGEAAAPVTPEHVAALMRIPDLALAFQRAASGPLEALAAEGNASAPSPSTISAQGATTATNALPPSADPAANAPMTPPPPSPPTAPPHGSPGDPA